MAMIHWSTGGAGTNHSSKDTTTFLHRSPANHRKVGAIEHRDSASGDRDLRAHSHNASCSSSLTVNVAEMRKVFQRFDENCDGLICEQDLLRFMSRFGFPMSQEDASSTLASLDHNGDGMIDFEEFLSLYKTRCDEEACSSDMDTRTASEEEEQAMLDAFRVFDKNDDGLITAQELQTVLLDLGMSEGKSLKNCEKMIQSVDVDGNGQIDITEFREMMSRKFIFVAE